MACWNPWHGCHKISAGCQNCYVYRIDAQHGRDSTVVEKTSAFNLPVRRSRSGAYKIPPGEWVFTCFSSDFFVEEADAWRADAWRIMRMRSDLQFFFITKRPDRFYTGLPEDWGEGYENVTVCCTVENQDRANFRLPIFRELPIRHKQIICEPLLGPIDLTRHLGSWVQAVIVGGESGLRARVCDYDWVLDIRRQCIVHGVAFSFRQTGALFKKGGRIYRIARRFQHEQARKANISTAEPE